jgi:hypothetical protein
LLGRSPIFTVVAVASLGVGLASAVGLFTTMKAMLFRLLLGDSAANILVAQERCRLFRDGLNGSPGYSDSVGVGRHLNWGE